MATMTKTFLCLALTQGGDPSSYNPVRHCLTWSSVVNGNALTARAIRAPLAIYLSVHESQSNV